MAGNPLADNVNLLRQGLLDLQQSVQGLQFQRVLANANEQVRNIRAAEGKEEEKRQALHQIANDLTFQMAGMGVPATTMQQISGAVDPDRGFREKMALMLAKQQASGAAQQQEKPLPGDIEFATNVEVGRSMIRDLRETVKEFGTFESRIGNKAAAAKLKSGPTQLASLWPKIQDPSTASKENEVNLALNNLLNMGLFSDNEVALKSLDQLEKSLNLYERARSNASAKFKGQQVQVQVAPVDLGIPGLTPIK